MHLTENQYNRDIRHYMNIRNVDDKHHRDCIKDLKNNKQYPKSKKLCFHHRRHHHFRQLF